MEKKKYNVSPTGEVSLLTTQTKSLTTENKSQAVKHAKYLAKLYVEISFNVDTYVDGVCVKNEFGRFENGEVSVYSVVNYKPKKITKPTYKASDYFNEEDLKIIEANQPKK